MILINPLVVHHQIQLLMDALKHAANQFVQANRQYRMPVHLVALILSFSVLRDDIDVCRVDLLVVLPAVHPVSEPSSP